MFMCCILSLTVTRDEMDKLANFLSQVSNQVSISTFILRILNGLVVIHGLVKNIVEILKYAITVVLCLI